MLRPAFYAFLLFSGLTLLSTFGRAADLNEDVGKSTFSIGLSYPGLGAKYFLTDHYAVEAKAQFQTGVTVGGLRAYRYFRPVPRIYVYLGAEADYLRFKGTVSAGSGYAGEAFGGLEYFVMPHVSVQADLGPAYVDVKDRATSLSAGGLEFVMNFGINYYFGKGPAKPAQDVAPKRKLDPWIY